MPGAAWRHRWVAAALVLLVGVAACGGTASGPAPTPGSPGPAATAAAIASPVQGVVVKLQSEGLTRVIGFHLRTDDGREVAFVMGTLENGVEFPPGHLAEHMATAQRVRVYFRDEGGSRVVYRIEDAPPGGS